MKLSDSVKSAIEVKGAVLKSILNDLNNDRLLILNDVINDSSTSDNMVYVSTLESLVRQLITYQNLIERE